MFTDDKLKKIVGYKLCIWGENQWVFNKSNYFNKVQYLN